MARRKFPPDSAQRSWGAFGTGLTLTPVITFLIEILILLLIGIFWLFLIQARPELEQDILYLAEFDITSPPLILRFRLDGLANLYPGLKLQVTILLYLSFLIPLVEELLKPLAVYFLLRRKLQPWEGFVFGATAGAGFALFENLTIGAGAETWTFVTLTRLGTAAIHILTTGLIGWGLASACNGEEIWPVGWQFYRFRDPAWCLEWI